MSIRGITPFFGRRHIVEFKRFVSTFHCHALLFCRDYFAMAIGKVF
jgi:hypothetical protein